MENDGKEPEWDNIDSEDLEDASPETQSWENDGKNEYNSEERDAILDKMLPHGLPSKEAIEKCHAEWRQKKAEEEN